MNRIFNHKEMAKLDNPARRALLPPQQVLDGIDLLPGQTLLDIGAGTGYFSLPALERVGEAGRVIAADLSEEMLAELERRLPPGEGRVETVLCGKDAVPLPDRTAHRILLAFVFHEIPDQGRYVSKTARLLEEGGTVTVVEWRREETPAGPPLDHRISEEELIRVFASQGFTPVKNEKLNTSHYLVVFRRSDS